MRRAAALLPLALGACATTEQRVGGHLLFAGGERDWRVAVRERSVVLRERVGRGVWIYVDSAPSSEPIAGGLRYRGVLHRDFVVAGMAEEQELAYALDIVAAGCSPAAPATITLRTGQRDDPAISRTVCGRASSRRPR